jgi:hypothetical protein
LTHVKRDLLRTRCECWILSLNTSRMLGHFIKINPSYFLFPQTSMPRPALGPTQPPVQWVPAVLSTGVKRGRGVTLTTHRHLVPRSRMSRNYTSSNPLRLQRCVMGLHYLACFFDVIFFLSCFPLFNFESIRRVFLPQRKGIQEYFQ